MRAPRIVLIDDLRRFGDGTLADVARAGAEGVTLLRRLRRDTIDELWLDRDLLRGDNIEPVIDLLLEAASEGNRLNIRQIYVSASSPQRSEALASTLSDQGYPAQRAPRTGRLWARPEAASAAANSDERDEIVAAAVVAWLSACPPGAQVRWNCHSLDDEHRWTDRWADISVLEIAEALSLNWVWTIWPPGRADQWPWPALVLDPTDEHWVTTRDADGDEEGAWKLGWTIDSISARLTEWTADHTGRDDITFAFEPEVIDPLAEHLLKRLEGVRGKMTDQLIAEGKLIPDEVARPHLYLHDD